MVIVLLGETIHRLHTIHTHHFQVATHCRNIDISLSQQEHGLPGSPSQGHYEPLHSPSLLPEVYIHSISPNKKSEHKKSGTMYHLQIPTEGDLLQQ